MEPNSGIHPEAFSGLFQLQLQSSRNGSGGFPPTTTNVLPPASVQRKAVALPQFQLLPRHNVSQNSRGISKCDDDDDTIHDVWGRKVRISEDSSIYGLCRTWVRNGLHEMKKKTQPRKTTGFLPKPLPKSNAAKKVEVDKEDHASVGHLSAQNLLQSHIKRAKKVRERLRAERFQQILRYRFRLAALLPTQPQPR